MCFWCYNKCPRNRQTSLFFGLNSRLFSRIAPAIPGYAAEGVGRYMTTLNLKNKFQTNVTLISNNFIDNYMVQANGEFVKVYLFLLRHLNSPYSNLSISMIADCLNNTESDILRAFKYWSSEGLLNLERDANGKIIGLELLKVPVSETDTAPSRLPEDIPVSPAEPGISPTADASSALLKDDTVAAQTVVSKQLGTSRPVQKESSPADSLKAQKELKSLLFIAEQYLGKTLTHSDVEAITYFYSDLKMSARLIEYLIESCVENGHKSMHYIQKVAISWADNEIRTIEQAKQNSASYNKNCYTILNAFGIKNRGPADSELIYIRKWTNEMGFSLDIIQEACRRTISATHQPSFEYTNTILERWQQNQVHHLKDVIALDTVFQREKNSRKTTVTPNKTTAKNMNNFDRRSYDMDSLEEQLLKSH